MHDHLRKRHIYSAADTLDDATEANNVLLTFVPAVPIDIYRVGYILTTVFDAGSFASTLSVAAADGSTGADTAATFTTTVDRVANDVIYWDVIVPVAEADGQDSLAGGVTSQTSKINVAPQGGPLLTVPAAAPLRVYPGQSVIWANTEAATAGDGIGFIEYVELDLTGYGRTNIYRLN